MIVVDVILHPSSGDRPSCLGTLVITNDGTASDGSGDSPFGNYRVVADWDHRGKPKHVETRVEDFDRRKSALALLQRALEAIAEEQRK